MAMLPETSAERQRLSGEDCDVRALNVLKGLAGVFCEIVLSHSRFSNEFCCLLAYILGDVANSKLSRSD